MNKPLAHLRFMQHLASNYVAPGVYVEGAPPTAYPGKPTVPATGSTNEERAAIFAGDMIYCLDGPDSREVEAILSFDFIAESMVTASNDFHGEKVAIGEALSALREFSAAAEKLDRVKKALFYGRDFIANPTRPSPSRPEAGQMSFRLVNDVADRLTLAGGDAPGKVGDPLSEEERGNMATLLFHAIVGVATESGEMVDAWLKAYMGREPLDLVNLQEEFGDNQWYVAIALHAFGQLFGVTSRDFNDLHEIVNKKLRHRFPAGFTEFDANNRDLTGERAILETGAFNPHPDQTSPMTVGPEAFEDDTFDAEQVEAGEADAPNSTTGGQDFEGV